MPSKHTFKTALPTAQVSPILCHKPLVVNIHAVSTDLWHLLPHGLGTDFCCLNDASEVSVGLGQGLGTGPNCLQLFVFRKWECLGG